MRGFGGFVFTIPGQMQLRCHLIRPRRLQHSQRNQDSEYLGEEGELIIQLCWHSISDGLSLHGHWSEYAPSRGVKPLRRGATLGLV